MHWHRLLAACLTASALPATIDYQRDIRPILSDNCYSCHGPDASKRMANLRLDTLDKAPIVPGQPLASPLYQRITSPNPATRMPPASTGHTLTDAQKSAIGKWIEAGATVDAHWAYAPLKSSDPTKANIDRFILARLQQEGLQPSPEADKIILLRRVSLDLTGLPPTTAEIKTFLADTAPDAYEKLVDRLLASPHYGERMAFHWLDLARYGDTHGYQLDTAREMWPWRDWVIRAFNSNMPFDRFTIEQLAGDLLENPTRDQLIATGFNRNHRINAEGGSLAEEFLPEYVVDRVETTATVWLGTTLGCARCHDHKYDPFPQRDFYRFFAYFNNVPENGIDGVKGNAQPTLALPTEDQERQLAHWNAVLADTEKKISADAVAPLLAKWEQAKEMPPAPRAGLLAHYAFNGSLDDLSGNYQKARLVRGELRYDKGPVDLAAAFNGVTHAVTPVKLPAAFSIAAWLKSDSRMQMSVIQNTETPESRRGFEMLIDESRPLPGMDREAYLLFRQVNHWPDSRLEFRSSKPVAQRTAHHFVFAYDGSGKASGVHILLDGKPLECTILTDTLSGSTISTRPLEIGNPDLGTPLAAQLDDLRIYNRPLTDSEARILAVEEPIRAIFLQPADKRSKDDREKLRAYFLRNDAPADLQQAYSTYTAALAARNAVQAAVTTVMVMKESAQPRDTFILARGDYRNKTEKVAPGLPAAIASNSSTFPPNRLGLAQWLVDPSNPLTARVAVNRYWQMYFGTGLVKTMEDFGSQGELPSHPELLDWLASEFIRTGWDVKKMQRLIVTSATYKQSSAVTPELLSKDPENRLLARASRFRLPAEVIRDNALAAAGILSPKIGGPSVFPDQPEGLWEEVSVGDVYSAQQYTQSHGEDLHRRAMYTFWKRAIPPPELTLFDATDRDKCTVRRTLTNTPLQALVLMNDPNFLEAARLLAARAKNQPAEIFRLATSREPSPAEIATLVQLATESIARYRRDPEATHKLLPTCTSDCPNLAAWTIVATTILNLDETITRQ